MTPTPAQPGLKRFEIRIRTDKEQAIQACIARNSGQAWQQAFNLAEQLLGDVPPRSISVRPFTRPAGFVSGQLKGGAA